MRRSCLTLLLASLSLCFFLPASAKKAKQEKPKQERMATLFKNARTALKNQNGQDAARDALLGALARPEMKNRQKAKIYFTAAQLEESLNGVENRKAYLKQAYDTARFFNKLCDMYTQLRLCDSIGQVPDAKGRIHPYYQKRAQRLRMKHSRNILSGGKFFLAKKNYAAAYPFFDNYCSVQPDSNAIRWATLSAFLSENGAGTIKYADRAIAISDPATAAILHEYKARAWSSLGNDSAWVQTLRWGVQLYPQHDWFFVQLSDWYQAHRAFGEERALADDLIRRTGGKAIHYYAKSKSNLSEDNFRDCIACADSCIALEDNFVDAYYNKGIAYLNMAVIASETAPKDVNHPDYFEAKLLVQEYYRQARPCMEKVRQLQPDNQERWGPPLYRIYLHLNLGDEFNEIDKLLNQKQ